MVGVPGRSKACHTCRRRRKGVRSFHASDRLQQDPRVHADNRRVLCPTRQCDQLRPSCTQCIRIGAQCEGYERERIFMNSTTRSQGKALPPQLIHRRHEGVVAGDVVLAASLGMTAREEKYVSLFFEIYAPRGRVNHPHWKWAGSAQELYRTDPALKCAMLAISLSALGDRDNCHWMRVEGFRAYGQALQEETRALMSPSRKISDPVILATKFMTMFEMLFGDNATDCLEQARHWRSHNIGAMAIMDSRTPSSAIEGHGHLIFIDSRLIFTISAIKQRKRVFMSSHEWKTTPWQKIPKSPRDVLVDTLIDIPGLLEETDSALMIKDLRDRQKEYGRLLELHLECDERLQAWYHTVRTGTSHTDGSGLALGDDASEAADISTMLLYWTTCLHLYGATQALISHMPTDGETTKLPRRIANLGYYTSAIGRALPVFLASGGGKSRLLATAFPLGTALQFMHLLYPPKEGQTSSDHVMDLEAMSEDERDLLKLTKEPQMRPIMTFLISLQKDVRARDGSHAATYNQRAKHWARWDRKELDGGLDG